MIKSVSQGLDYALSVTLTTSGSLMTVLGNDNHAFASKNCYDHFATAPLFHNIVMGSL